MASKERTLELPAHDDSWIELAHDLEELAERIRRAVDDPERTRSVGTHARLTLNESTAIARLFWKD